MQRSHRQSLALSVLACLVAGLLLIWPRIALTWYHWRLGNFDSNVRAGALERLVALGPRARPLLLDALLHGPNSLYERRKIIAALADAHDPKALSVLVQRLEHTECSGEELDVSWLRQLGVEATAALVDLIFRCDSEPGSNGVTTAFAALDALGPRALEPLLAALERRGCAECGDSTLGAELIDHPTATATRLASLLDDIGAPAVRPLLESAQLAWLLGGMKSSGVREALLAYLTDQDPILRAAAARALGELRSDEAILSLTAKLASTEGDAVEGVLHELGSAADAALVATLEGPEPTARIRAARVLGAIGDERALAALAAHANDSDASLTSAIALAQRSAQLSTTQRSAERLRALGVPDSGFGMGANASPSTDRDWHTLPEGGKYLVERGLLFTSARCLQGGGPDGGVAEQKVVALTWDGATQTTPSFGGSGGIANGAEFNVLGRLVQVIQWDGVRVRVSASAPRAKLLGAAQIGELTSEAWASVGSLAAANGLSVDSLVDVTATARVSVLAGGSLYRLLMGRRTGEILAASPARVHLSLLLPDPDEFERRNNVLAIHMRRVSLSPCANLLSEARAFGPDPLHGWSTKLTVAFDNRTGGLRVSVSPRYPLQGPQASRIGPAFATCVASQITKRTLTVDQLTGRFEPTAEQLQGTKSITLTLSAGVD